MTSGRLVLVVVAVWGGSLALFSGVAAADAGVIDVTTTDGTSPAGDGLCSLAEAVQSADGSASADCPGAAPSGTTIVVPASTSHYTIPSTLSITAPITIQGAGPTASVIDGGGAVQVLHVATNATAGIEGVTITGGMTGTTLEGACTGSGKTLACPPRDGGRGGGILNEGTLTLSDSVVTDNHAAAGLPATRAPAGCDFNCPARTGESGGSGGSGGGIENLRTLTILGSTISHNTAGAGATGTAGVSGTGTQAGAGADGGGGGSGGEGGGVNSEGAASLTITDSIVSDNTAGAGGGAGAGGAATASGDAGGDAGSPGYGGFGGGISDKGQFTLSASTVDDNAAGAGGAGASGGAGDGSGSKGMDSTQDPGGQGGGMRLAGVDDVTVVDATIAGNAAGAGGISAGGGLSTNGPRLQLSFSTIADNSAGEGSGLAVSSSTVTEDASVISGNSGTTSCYVSGGHAITGEGNVAFGDGTCLGLTADPKLGSLADNGGPTPTMALGAGSPAIDLVPASLCPPPGEPAPFTDQRGVTRPQGGACDAGAYEHAPPSVGAVTATAISSTAAEVSAPIDANAQTTSASVAYGTTNAYGNLTTAQTVTGVAPTSFAVTLTGLSPATTYHYAISATNADGTTTTTDATFATPSAPPPPETTPAPPPAPPAPPTPLVPPVAAVAPALTKLALTPASFLPVTKVHRTKRGTKISYTDSAAATTTFTVQRATQGVRKGAVCVGAPKKRSSSSSKPKTCTRFVTINGSFSHQDVAGVNTVAWTGDLRGSALAAGTYRLTATPELDKLVGTAVTHTFTVKRSL